ncbi:MULTISPECIES: ABC transporter permease [unclassified Pseudoalteromonas]|uniref:ABC transporter permease n=1 Tax=unclassified Pseudoalteromonas TaxID=194690 RepID=UPI0005A8CBD5|nr:MULTISPECIES: ABC transporter permease [unclassified Pseudoalteromonas]
MNKFSSTPVEMFFSLWKHRTLLLRLIKRDIIGRYKGSIMGIFWSFFNPLLMLAIYTFVFGEVFNARWSGGVDSKVEFALILFSGLIVFNLFSECISQAPGQIIANKNYVKKVIFPIETLSWVTMGSAIFHFIISMTVWIIAYILLYGVPHFTILFTPIILLLLMGIIMGFSWFLAAFGVYLRDIGQVVTLLITATMFLSPIFFPLSAMPQVYQPFLMMNPLTIPIEQLRAIAFYGELPNWNLLFNYSLVSTFIAWLGFVCFQKTRKGFADVL